MQGFIINKHLYYTYHFQVRYVLNRHYVSTLKEWHHYIYFIRLTTQVHTSALPNKLISYNKRSVTSHMILKVTEMIFKQIFTGFKLLISKTKNTLNLQFFVLAFKKFCFQHPPLHHPLRKEHCALPTGIWPAVLPAVLPAVGQSV